MSPDIKKLSAALTKANARWRAKETPQSLLSDEKKRRLLGVDIPKSVLAAMAAPATAAAPAPAFAPAVDWRNKNGNHVSPVKDQGGCGSCVSFGCAGLIESMAHIELGNWLDLSEADSHFCSNHGANCGGWWPESCLDQVIARGICDEACFPYASAFPNNDIWSGPPQCHLAPDRDQRAVKIGSRAALTDATSMKNHLSNVGPLAGCFTVYDDFFSYESGVYHHVSGAEAGGHCVLVIGYSEAEQCWICKNSWGSGWGDGGFFRIAYSDFKYGGNLCPMYSARLVHLPTSGWQSLHGGLSSRIAVGRNQDGRLEVFARGMDGGLWHVWQTSPNGTWSGWSSLGGVITSDPCVVSNADGRLEVFARGTDNAVWHVWQTKPNNGWSNWASLGGTITSNPVAGRNKDGRLEVFARGADGALWHIWQTKPNNGWSGWASLGVHFSGNPAVGRNADGRLEVFFIGPKNAVHHLWQVTPNGTWSNWASLGGVVTDSPVAGHNADGRLEVFARGVDGALYHVWQTQPNGGWSGWSSLGGSVLGQVAIGNNADGRLEVFACGANAAVWHNWQKSPNGTWVGWASLGGSMQPGTAVGSNADGRLEVFVCGLDRALWHRWQTKPNNGWN